MLGRLDSLVNDIRSTVGVAAKGTREPPERNRQILPDATAAERAWLAQRERVHGLRDVDRGHKCTAVTCGEDGSLEMVDWPTNLYGCIRSGVVHQCQGSERTCANQRVSEDGTIVCVFSGVYLGVLIDRRNPMCWGKAKTGYDLPGASPDDEDDDGEDDADDASSGDSPFKRGARSRGSQPRRHENVYRDIRTVVEDLLYNQGERTRVDSLHVNAMRSAACATVAKYYNDCKHAKRLPRRHELESLRHREMNTRPRLGAFPYNGLRADYYAGLLMRLWTMVQGSPGRGTKSGPNAKCHALGTLYLMQTQFSVPDGEGRQRELLPKDDFLYWNLPHQGDLRGWKSARGSRWKYVKGNITRGRNCIRASVNSAGDPHERARLFNDMKALFARAPPLTEREAFLIPNLEGPATFRGNS